MMTNEVSEFAQLVAHFRQQQGMSQGQLAQATRLSRTYVYHLETGQRENPSPHVVQSIARALELQSEDRQQLYAAYTELTGNMIDTEHFESTLLDLGELARLLVLNTSYPAHSLDRLWYLHSWNKAAIKLFDIEERAEYSVEHNERAHLLWLVFDPELRRRFHGWENLARRLVSDFLYNTRTVTHLPEYKTLWKQLREMPEFKRIASSAYPQGKPVPSFVFQIQHSELGRLTLRTATTVFTGISSYSMVSYVPGDQQTLNTYRRQDW
jgi:transcriptional regulator with XRE-family HTH domain